MSLFDKSLDEWVPFVKENSFLIVVFLTSFITVMRMLSVSLILEPFGRWALKNDKRKDQILPKLLESLWFFFYYTGTFALSSYLLWTAEWATATRNYWDDTFSAPPIEDFPNIFLYLVELSNYISALIFILFLDHGRKNHKDKLIMTTHHIVTILLISISYVLCQHRIGLVVLAIHDMSDVVLEGSKCLKYLKFDRIVNVGFAIFASTFFLTRLIALPYFVLRPIVIYYPNDITYDVRHCIDGNCDRLTDVLLSISTKGLWLTLLGTLQLLHVYWFGLISRMVVYALREKSVSSDIRSDDEEDIDEDLVGEKKSHTKLRKNTKKMNGRM